MRRHLCDIACVLCLSGTHVCTEQQPYQWTLSRPAWHDVRLIAESYAIVGEPAIAPYATMGSPELADSVAGSFKEHTCCVLMENHGVLCTGDSLLQAFDRIEVLENTARINLQVAQLGGGVELNAAQLREIDAMMGR